MNWTEYDSLTREQLLEKNTLLENQISELENMLEQKDSSDYDEGYNVGYDEGLWDGRRENNCGND